MCKRPAAVLLALLVEFASHDVTPAAAQWWMDAALGGASHEAVAAHVSTNSLLLAVRRDGPVWAQIAGGVPLGSGSARWGSVAGGAELVRPGRFAVGGRFGGQGYAYASDSPNSEGWGAIGEVGPLVRFAWKGADVEARSSVIASWTVVDDDPYSRLLFSSAADAGLQLAAGLQLNGAAQLVFSKDATYPLVAATISQLIPYGGWWGRFGYWLNDEVESPEWSVGVYGNVGGKLQLHALYRQETNDPIYQRVPRRSWSLGLSVALGRSEPPVPMSPVSVAGSLVTVRLPLAESAGVPSIAGDFNAWKPLEMARDGEYWTASFTVLPGTYRYSFRSEDGAWFLPSSIRNRVDDGFGGENGVLVVP